eukprot:1511361-Amphidinium_carterae.1
MAGEAIAPTRTCSVAALAGRSAEGERGAYDVKVQAQVLFNFFAKVSQAATHLQLGVSHCMVEGVYLRCRLHLADYVLKLQDDIVLG